MDIIASLDIGSQTTRVLVAEQQLGEKVKILGIGEAVSEGIQRGNIVNIEKASGSIVKALKDAEKMAQIKLTRVVVAVGGDSLMWKKSHGMVPISRDKRTITKKDVASLIKSARAVVIPADHMIVESFVERYMVDSQQDVEDPIGMTGVRLEGDVNIATIRKGNIENIERILESQKLDVEFFTLGIQGTSLSVLTEPEAELGVSVIDIGAGTTDIAIFRNKRMVFADVVRYAGGNITSDLSICIKIPLMQAEELKYEYGHSIADQINENEMVKIPGIGGRRPRETKRRILAEIVESRVEEIFTMVKERLEMSGLYNSLTAGIVITGGSSVLPGLLDTAEKILGLPVRIGIPGDNSELEDIVKTPFHSAAIGSILVSLSKENLPEEEGNGILRRFSSSIKRFWMTKVLKS